MDKKRGQAGPSQNLKQSLLQYLKYKNGSVFYFGVVISLRQCGKQAQRVKQLHPCNCLEKEALEKKSLKFLISLFNANKAQMERVLV